MSETNYRGPIKAKIRSRRPARKGTGQHSSTWKQIEEQQEAKQRDHPCEVFKPPEGGNVDYRLHAEVAIW